jgi:penicillin amidase
LRGSENELRGLVPAPGWLERYDWHGFVPFEELPQELQPPSGRIVTANQKITPPDYAHWVTSEWAPPYRAQRIQTLLDASPKHSVQSFARIQSDVQSGTALLLLPLLLDEIAPPSDAEQPLLERLKSWNLEMRAGAAEPLLFATWLRELSRAIYADELGPLFADAWSERPVFLANVLGDVQGQSRWCDDVSTAPSETCSEQVSGAFTGALADLRQRYGDEPAGWSWGAAHSARSSHVPFGALPGLGGWFDLQVPSAGDNQTVNVGGYFIGDEEQPFENHMGPGLRAIYDLGQPEASVFITNGGQSGHFLSPHYRDFNQAWARVEHVPMQTRRASVELGQLGTLRLSPP